MIKNRKDLCRYIGAAVHDPIDWDENSKAELQDAAGEDVLNMLKRAGLIILPLEPTADMVRANYGYYSLLKLAIAASPFKDDIA